MQKEDRSSFWIFLLLFTAWSILGSQPLAAQEKWDRVIDLEGEWKFTIGDKQLWADRYYNDASWETIYVPAPWEEEGFHGYDGYGWYRTTFNGTALEKDKSYSLALGYIDDADEVYVNGKKIGSSGSFPPRFHTAYRANRSYFIPPDVIDFKGRNVIAVRVYDAYIDGGIISGDIGIYTSRNDIGLAVNLRGVWNFKVTGRRNDKMGANENWEAAAVAANDWSDITVPGAWEVQGYPKYDGTAWYKKDFVIPKQLAGQDLILLVGKIDDSDRTFLNGKLVGTMTDMYRQLRAYPIAADQFKPGEINTLVIFVDDPQGFGGIYEGPVGIMKQTDYTRYLRWK